MKDIIINSSNRGAGYWDLRSKWGGIYGYGARYITTNGYIDGNGNGYGNGYEDRYGCKYGDGIRGRYGYGYGNGGSNYL